MNFFKKYFIAILILFSTNYCYSENWQDVSINNKQIFIDTDSVNYHKDNDSIYYNVKYKNQQGEFIIVTIQSKDNKAGVIATYKNSDYIKNKKIANTTTKIKATVFQDIKTTSLLYNANITAKNIYSQNKQNSNNNINAVDFGDYMKKMEKKIKKNWNPPTEEVSQKAVVIFSIAKNGRLIGVKMQYSSGVEEVDRAAIEAVEKSAPFEPLPSEYPKDSVDIQFTFDYNVHKR